MIFSVIIPALNEEKQIAACIQSIRDSDPSVEIIVVDGGSTDRTTELARSACAKVAVAKRGRGAQQNHGAALAIGDILVFLHADTIVSPDLFAALRKSFSHPDIQIGTCILAFDRRLPLLRLYAYCARLDSVWTTFGDQCIVCRRTFFDHVGGFLPLPLFEDVEFLQRARKRTRIQHLPTTVVTSARRFIENGIIRQQVRNAMLLLLYIVGVSPARLSLMYNRQSKTTKVPASRGTVFHQLSERSEALCERTSMQ